MTVTRPDRPGELPDVPGGPPPTNRVQLRERTLRQDRWWVQSAVTAAVLLTFVVYATWAAFQNANYFYEPYISPLYSPCIATNCDGDTFVEFLPLPSWFSVALIILIVPGAFRLTCYYYRKAYYRAFWQSPPACVVAEPHKRYTGETRFPLILQNSHRYWFYLASIFNIVLTFDAILAFRDHEGAWGHMGLGTLVLVINAALLWAYSLSCHSCRHIVGGKLNNFSKHPLRYRFWGYVSRLNARHMQIAWVSLVWVGLTDLYIRLLASGTISDLRFF
ncbi:MAG: hypothetical protein M3450_07895 [Actinomycetota bacterium]|nr:hypothetical protein [Actinomycetota bacterium]